MRYGTGMLPAKDRPKKNGHANGFPSQETKKMKKSFPSAHAKKKKKTSEKGRFKNSTGFKNT